VIEGLNNKKAPGEDGITAEIYKITFKIFQKNHSDVQWMSKKRDFPAEMDKGKNLPIMNPGKQTCEEFTKCSTISLLNVGGKILEMALINRAKYYINSTEFLNKTQYGFIPQTGTTDGDMAAKYFVQEGCSKGEITANVSLDVEGTFNSAWSPCVLKNLQESGYPQNLYNITKNYVCKRRANM